MPEYCEIAVPVPLDRLFTYSVPDSLALQPGMRVEVPFAARKVVGVVVRCGVTVSGLDPASIRPVHQAVDGTPPLTEELLRLGRWLANYYLTPEGEVLAAILPPQPSVHRKTRVLLTPAGEQVLRAAAAGELPERAKPAKPVPPREQQALQRLARRGGLQRESLGADAPVVEKLRRRGWVTFRKTIEPGPLLAGREETSPLGTVPEVVQPPSLSRPQTRALERIERNIAAGKFGVFLLHGVTGSGKTEVYLRAIERALARHRSALMLVPEINLTPAMAAQFAGRFGARVAVLHSGLPERERADQWLRVQQGHSDVVLGTRSAVFAPLNRPGVIIVDEEHDTSYKQDEAPRYHGRDVAILRAQQAGATVVLGSATPAIETRYNAETGKYHLLELEQRILERPMPETEIVDMRQEFADTGKQSFLSRRLEEQIARRLEQREQNLILLNRRGYSAAALCRSCGQTLQCENCSIALTHHRRIARLLCHYCGFARPVPRFCPHCASEHLYFLGEGSERIEEALHRRFPEARIGRLDRDTARGRGRAEAILAAFRNHELDILVGTQMIAKGHDIHRVTLVGVISADTGLARPDFRAAERTFQLLTQVAGRAGRGELPGEVVIQTYYPDHYAIRAAAAQDYALFYPQELRFRRLMHYPPFTVLANLVVKSRSAETAMKMAGRLGRHLESQQQPGLKLLGPAAAPLYRLKRDYRYQFLIKASRRSLLREVLVSCRDFARSENFPAASLIVDVDPQSLS